jgi:PKD repeat protein
MKTQLFRCLIGVALLCPWLAWQAHSQPAAEPGNWLARILPQTDLVVEGKITQQQSQWDPQRKTVFTRFSLNVYKVAKGQLAQLGTDAQFWAEGGATEQYWVATSGVLPNPGETGLYFLRQVAGRYELIPNGFAHYDPVRCRAVTASGVVLGNLRQQVYPALQAGGPFTHVQPGSDRHLAAFEPRPANARTENVEIESFFPRVVEAGTRTRLVINGSGFGARQGQRGNVLFTRNQDGGASMQALISEFVIWQPDFSELISWSDTRIEVYVPAFAGTGPIAVRNDRGEIFESLENLQINYSLTTQKFGFFGDTTGISRPPQNPLLLNVNSEGGYTVFVDPQFFANARQMAALGRAFATWRCATGINLQIAAAEGPIGGQGFNGVSSITLGEVPPFGDDSPSYFFSAYETCQAGGQRYHWMQGFTMVLDRNLAWAFEGTPSPREMDFESEVLRLLGRAGQLEAVNNPADLMYYRLRPGQVKRQLNANNRTAGNRIVQNSLATAPICSPAALQRVPDANCQQVVARPVARFDTDRTALCGPGEVRFTNQSRHATSFAWQFPGGTPASSTERNPSVRYERDGTYSVTLVATGPSGENRLERANLIRVSAGSLSVNLGRDTVLCPGQRLTLDAGVADAEYEWSNGANTRRLEVVRPGRYSVKVRRSGCEATDEIVIAAVVEAGITNRNVRICTGNSAPLAATGGTSYEWFPAEGLSDPRVANPVARPQRTTLYRVRIRTNSACGEVVDSVRVTVSPQPVLAQFPDDEVIVCRGGQAFLNAQVPGDGYTYQWSNGSRDPSLVANQPGLYWVRVTGPGGCSASDTVRVSFTDQIRAQVAARQITVCEGGQAELRASGGAFYIWSPSVGLSNPFSARPTVRPTRTTTYTVRVTGNGPCPGDSAQVTVTVVARPTVELGPSPLIACEPSVELNAGNEGAIYRWNTGATSQRLRVTRAGRYWVSVKPRNCDTEVTDTVEVRFPAVARVDLGPDTLRTCRPSLELNAGNPGLRYRWQDGSTAQRFRARQSGRYRVTVTDSCGRTATDSMMVSLERLAEPFARDTVSVCGNDLLLDAGNPGATYRWPDGSTARRFSATQNGRYVVTITDSCQNTLRDSVYVLFPRQLTSIWPDTLRACEPNFVLDAGPGGTAYRWQDGSTQRRLTVRQSGRYSVQITTSCGNTVDDVLWVAFFDPTNLDFTFEPDRNDPSQVRFQAQLATAHRTRYEWDFGDGNRGTGARPSHQYQRVGAYQVRLTATSLDCPQSQPRTVEKVANIVVAGEDPTAGRWFAVYPNPSASGQFQVRWASQAQGRTVRIADLQGRVLLPTQPVPPSEETTLLELSELPTGLYLLEIEVGGQKFTRRLVRQ